VKALQMAAKRLGKATTTAECVELQTSHR